MPNFTLKKKNTCIPATEMKKFVPPPPQDLSNKAVFPDSRVGLCFFCGLVYAKWHPEFPWSTLEKEGISAEESLAQCSWFLQCSKTACYEASFKPLLRQL